MTLSNLYRAFIDWAERPSITPANENALWRLSPHELADLPIGPEPEDEGSAFAADRRDRCA